MLRGRFGNTSNGPYLEGYISFPRLGVKGLISFLVDTGADSSIIMPTDGKKLGIDYRNLTNRSSSDGLGGSANEFQELAILSFSDPKYVYSYVLREVAIAEPAPFNRRYPSLLGREILHRWRFVMDKARDQVLFTPVTWDSRQRL